VDTEEIGSGEIVGDLAASQVFMAAG